MDARKELSLSLSRAGRRVIGTGSVRRASTGPGLICAAGLVVATTAPAAHAAKYQLESLAAPAQASNPQVTALNNKNQIVGYALDSSSDDVAVLWSSGEPTVVASTFDFDSQATAINNQGIVVGTVNPDGGPFAWSPSFYNQLYDGIAFAGGINDQGVIVGSLGGIAGGHGVVWASPLASTSTGGLDEGSSFFGSQGNAINESGTIVGFAVTSTNDTHAARWASASAKVHDLGTLGGASSEALAINAAGDIVGWADLGNGVERAALWGPHTGAYNLGTLGGKASYASGINAEGDVAGSAQTSTGAWHAVLWTHKHYVPIDLNTEIDAADAKRFTLTEAVATNDLCRVIANGQDNKTGAPVAFVLLLTDATHCNDH